MPVGGLLFRPPVVVRARVVLGFVLRVVAARVSARCVVAAAGCFFVVAAGGLAVGRWLGFVAAFCVAVSVRFVGGLAFGRVARFVAAVFVGAGALLACAWGVVAVSRLRSLVWLCPSRVAAGFFFVLVNKPTAELFKVAARRYTECYHGFNVIKPYGLDRRHFVRHGHR